ncbi:MAG: FMN-binding negative transcriptional regulator [Hyphomicrobiaceae bacterium]|nr:FMN-binding negative transcriptional regulator [Hyphomicrobiaceae bacterium]
MYVNPAFRTEDEDAWAYVIARGFGAVVAHDQGQPVASQVPLLVTERDGRKRIEFHVARPNPLHEVVARSPRVLVVVSGPDAYISPDWYASEDQVPTWNYLAAHITGQARPLPPAETLDHVERMSLHFEERLRPKKPWSTSKMTPRKREAMLRAIVAMEIEVEGIQASTKLGQNKGLADRMEAARMLAWRGGWAETAVAEAMRGAIRAESASDKEGG